MPLGILQPKAGHPPGTVLLLDSQDQATTTALKHGNGKVKLVILVLLLKTC